MTPAHLACAVVAPMVVVLFIVSIAFDDWRSGYEGEHGDERPQDEPKGS